MLDSLEKDEFLDVLFMLRLGWGNFGFNEME